jgi:hypothetical protein
MKKDIAKVKFVAPADIEVMTRLSAMVANKSVKTSFIEPPLRPLLAQSSPSGLTLDCPVLGST